MSFDRTERQSGDEISQAEELSLKKTAPPAEIPGYSVQTFLGSGAYGEVWTGIDQNTGRRVAIKFYTRKSSVDFAMLAREVEKLAQLAADRYVVQLLDVGWDAEVPYYVMDHIENGSLEVELQKLGSFTVSEAIEMFQEVGIGLMHLHSRGILHCDLKPGNVLLDQDMKPRLADFGQSRLSHEQSAALGTLFYMAPEQADLQAVPDARWDVFALGALLYTMLTGAPPYRTDEVIGKLDSATEMNDRLERYRAAIAASPKPTKHRKLPGVDRRLADIVDRCIARNPDKRYDSVQSALLALRQREEARTRRPLMTLGLLGPLALFVVMGLFGISLYNQAIHDTKQSLLLKARESNNWASQFAARSAGERIDEYFRAVESLSIDNTFLETLRETLEDESITETREKLADPNQNSAPELDLQRARFIANPVRRDLDTLLRSQMTDSNIPETASWFVCDESGLQIASVFDADSISQTIGKNYAYRTYFHGGPDDLAVEDGDQVVYTVPKEIGRRKKIDGQHMSAIFISQATNLWKVAFSTPIQVDGEFIGVVACTVNMGDFIEFENEKIEKTTDEDEAAYNHYAMLVDAREGEHRGIILEHPLFNEFRLRDEPLPPRLSNYRVELASVRNKTEFVDPLSTDDLGSLYAKKWIPASADVKRKVRTPDGISQRKPTGLQVLTLENKEEVLKPVVKLSNTLLRIGLAALSVLSIVAIALWFLVMRSVRESTERVSRAFSNTTERSLSTN